MQLQSLRCITAIGGGHGLGRVLSTLSFMKHKLVGIVATTDNGGATGLVTCFSALHCLGGYPQLPVTTGRAAVSG